MTIEVTNIEINNEFSSAVIEMKFDIYRGEDGKDGVGGITDAPSDGNVWARKDGEWIIIPQPDLTNYYTKEETNDLLTTVYKYKGSVDYFVDLPTDAKTGDVYNVRFGVAPIANGVNYAYVEETSTWDDLGGIVGLATLTENGLMSKEDFAALAALKNHNHSGQSINPDNVVLNKEYTDVESEALAIGTIFYNIDQRCWLLKLSSVNYYNFGEEMPMLSRIGDNQTHLEGQACYISGGSTQLNNVSLASSVTGKLNCLATQDVLNTGDKTGYYCYFGQVRKFPYANVIKSTDNAATWVDGADLYLCNEAGKYSTVKEAAPAKASYVGRITNRNGANITVMFIPVEAKATTDLSDWDGNTNAFADAEKILIRKTNGLVQEMTKTDFYAILDEYFAKLSGGNTFAGAQIFTDRTTHNKGAQLNGIQDNDSFIILNVNYPASIGGLSDTRAIKLTSGGGNAGLYSPFVLFDVGGGGGKAYLYTRRVAGYGSRFYISTQDTIGNIINPFVIDENGNIQLISSKYQYNAASPTSDTINDIRTFNNNGVFTIQKCTAGSETKGGGTWVTTFTA